MRIFERWYFGLCILGSEYLVYFGLSNNTKSATQIPPLTRWIRPRQKHQRYLLQNERYFPTTEEPFHYRRALLENGRPCHFLEVKFHSRMCCPNTLVILQETFTLHYPSWNVTNAFHPWVGRYVENKVLHLWV